jgi:enoyl-CoA hydratase/carnithine racemase
MKLDTDKMIASKQNGIGWMVFNNPERRNAISYEMRVAALTILDDFETDPAIRVIIMKGAGDKSFISGSDISQFEKRMASPEHRAAAAAVSERLYARYETLSKPLIAMVQGFCLGGGLSTVLQADLCVAADNAVFGIPAARLGLAYHFRGTRRLVELVGPMRTKEILFTARRYSAAEALAIGLITQVVPHDQLEDTTRALAASIVGNAPLSVRAAKTMVKEIMKDADARDAALCDRAVAECLNSRDHREGRQAFMEKRQPQFTGT